MTRRPHYHTDQNLIDKTNRHIAEIEAKANAEIERLRLEQVEHDKRVIAHWEKQVEILNDELAERDREIMKLQKEVEKLRRIKKKVKIASE